MDWTELSDPAILKRLGERIKQHRIQMGLQQKELAEKSCVSLSTITKIEHGNPVSISLFISVLRTLCLLNNLDTLVPEVTMGPIQMKKLQMKKVHRVRKHKSE